MNRLCGSSMDAVAIAARAIRCGEADVIIAGGVESMSRAPFVMGKADAPFSRNAEIFDTTIGWRFVNPAMKNKYGIDSMAETAENVAEDFHVGRADHTPFRCERNSDGQKRKQPAFSLGNHPNFHPAEEGRAEIFDTDEHPRPDTTLKISPS